MKKTYSFLLALILLFSCSKTPSEEIYQGKLQELIVGEFTFHLDSSTKSIYEIRVVNDNGKELLLTTKGAAKIKGWAFTFVDPSSGREVNRIEIPIEGPESMKAGIFGSVFISKNQFYVINQIGDIGKYNGEGHLIGTRTVIKDYLENVSPEMPSFRLHRKIEFIGDSILQFMSNPHYSVKLGNHRSEFSVDFRAWIITLNINSGEIEASNFSIPEGYEKFKNDLTATNLLRTYDPKRNKSYIAWPGSNEIYVLNGVELVEKIIPRSTIQYNFIPTEVIFLGNSTIWALQKEASKNLFLFYDEEKDLILKCTKLNESGAGETKFERTKHYVLSVYSGDWDPLGEYFFDYESELDLENWFLTSEGLFINKPVQKSEDEYEFYKIDLSRFNQ